jgi:hypothetical protein
MSDLIAQGGAGGLGAFFGGVVSWLGFKQRLDAQDKRIDTLADSVQYEDTCDAKCGGMEKQVENQNVLLTEMRGDIKKLLGRKS